MEKKCICGDTESQHVDGSEHCFIVDCGCKAFEEEMTAEDRATMETERAVHASYPTATPSREYKCPYCGELCPRDTFHASCYAEN